MVFSASASFVLALTPRKKAPWIRLMTFKTSNRCRSVSCLFFFLEVRHPLVRLTHQKKSRERREFGGLPQQNASTSKALRLAFSFVFAVRTRSEPRHVHGQKPKTWCHICELSARIPKKSTTCGPRQLKRSRKAFRNRMAPGAAKILYRAFPLDPPNTPPKKVYLVFPKGG